MSDPSSHLSPALIMEAATGERQDSDATRHLETCAECRNSVQEWRDIVAELQSLKVMENEDANEACPSPEELASLFGVTAGVSQDALLSHVARCARCSGILSDVIGTGSEESADALRSSTKAWQRKLGAKLTVRASSHSAIRRYLPFAAAILLVAGGAAWWSQLRKPELATFLARAYTENRPFDFRLPDEGYHPVKQKRGSSAFERGEALIRAEQDVQKMLAAHPEDAQALGLNGRSRLLERDYAGAIESLNKALKRSPATPALLTDLGVAYALQAQEENKPEAYSRSANLFLEALRNSPMDQRIMFNLALVYEKAGMPSDAIRLWGSFLGLNPPDGWKQEAEAHLAQLKPAPPR